MECASPGAEFTQNGPTGWLTLHEMGELTIETTCQTAFLAATPVADSRLRAG